MRLRLLLAALFPLVLLAACTDDKPPAQETAEPVATATALPVSAEDVAQNYLRLWSEQRFAEMYELLSPEIKRGMSKERYVNRHEGIAYEARMTAIKAEPRGAVQETGEEAQARYSVTYSTTLWGEVQQENALPLVNSAEGWRVEWSPSLIFKELTGQNLVRAVIDTPRRGSILDREGRPLAVTGDVPTVGTAKNLINVPGIVADRNGLINYLANRLQMPAEEIRAKVDDPKTEVDVFIPLKTLPFGWPPEQVAEIENTPGVVVQRVPRRVYPYGQSASHVIGYIAPITAEQLETLKGEGYEPDDRIGATGLEASYEKELAGSRGARLTVITPEGGQVAELARRPGRPAQDVVTTLDIAVQQGVEAALGERVGSAVLLDPRDNSTVALASFPRFDPNSFINGLSGEEAGRLFNDPRKPLINRTIGATYPPGSTFKVITAAAGLERGGWTPTTRVECVPVWTGLGPGNPKRNWNNVNEGPQTVAEALMRSCNPTFYEIGLKLDEINPRILTDYAKAFGFGASTGINGLDDAEGVAPGPEWKRQALNEGWFTGDTVNFSIGQGYMLSTPLQIANAYSAIVNNGVLRSVVLVREVRESGTSIVLERTESKELGKIPMSPQTLNVLRQGTTMVTQDPRGTAYSVFVGSRLDAAGKSGTAEDQGVQEHALFAAYAPRSAARGVAVVVLDEGTSGSLEAGPLTRRVLETWVR